MAHFPLTVLSGGQTGVDMAALYAAEACKLPIAGWVPAQYTTESGAYGIPERFRPFLRETSTTASAERTERNIAEADGILTVLRGEGRSSTVSTGTQLGLDHAKKLGKREQQLCFVDLASSDLHAELERVASWIRQSQVTQLAVGGPRESEAPGIQKDAQDFLTKLFSILRADAHLD